ncbi:MAG: hypothetical protein J1E78_02525 [Muribaculaceae bacterium]|nr:hypothetical protein [Muribaculaceae bacterium]
MTTYSSPEVTLKADASTVFSKISNLENLRTMLDKVSPDKIPADKRQMFDNIKITADSIEVPGGPMGSLIFRVVEKRPPELIKLNGEGIPIAMSLAMHVKPEGETESKARVDIEIDIPVMLKPMVGGQIQKMANQFGEVLGAIPFA